MLSRLRIESRTKSAKWPLESLDNYECLVYLGVYMVEKRVRTRTSTDPLVVDGIPWSEIDRQLGLDRLPINYKGIHPRYLRRAPKTLAEARKRATNIEKRIEERIRRLQSQLEIPQEVIAAS